MPCISWRLCRPNSRFGRGMSKLTCHELGISLMAYSSLGLGVESYGCRHASGWGTLYRRRHEGGYHDQERQTMELGTVGGTLVAVCRVLLRYLCCVECAAPLVKLPGGGRDTAAHHY